MRRWATGMLAVALLGAPGMARAQAPDDCTVATSLRFPMGAVAIDLDGESRLAPLRDWTTGAPGRFLLIVAPPAGRDPRGLVRAASAADYLLAIATDRRSLGITDPAALAGRTSILFTRPDTVVVLACEGLLPQTLPVPFFASPVPAPVPPPEEPLPTPTPAPVVRPPPAVSPGERAEPVQPGPSTAPSP